MEMREITIVTLSVMATILIAFFISVNKIEMHQSPESFSKKEAICDCDSINSLLIDAGIENYRYGIILDRLWAKDTALYNEITKDLE